jgi:hypothetical protein
MKSKFMKLAAAAAVSFAFAAPASAAIGLGDSATLFLEVYDTQGTNTTYIRDLGVSLLNFGTQNRLTGGFTNIMDDQATDSLVSNADATWATFISGVSAPANLKWDVIAVDAAGGAGADLRRATYTSLTDPVAVIAPAGTQVTNAALNTLIGIDTHITAANVVLGANTSGIALGTDPASYEQAKSDSLNGSLNPGILGTSAAGLGQSMGFYYVTRSSTANGAEIGASAYKLTSGEAFQWTLDNAGNLTYGVTVTAAVPEPSTWAMFVAGALMLGGIARRRMS